MKLANTKAKEKNSKSGLKLEAGGKFLIIAF
jgi:hypothetical protein